MASAAKGRRNENDGRVRARSIHGFLHGVEYRDAVDAGSAFAGRHAGNDLRAVSHRLLGVKHALAAGDALHDKTRVFIN